MDTQFASPEKDGKDKLVSQFHDLSESVDLNNLINALPSLIAIINSNRQVVLANTKLMEVLEKPKIEELLGRRPGELLNCVYSGVEPHGCGTSEFCSACGAVKSILESQENQKTATTEARIITIKNNARISLDYSVTTTPYKWKDQVYYVFSLIDISDEKRRKILERLFFHDVLDKTGSVFGLLDLLKKEKNAEKTQKIIHYLDIISKELYDDLKSQREVSLAESGDLTVDIHLCNSLDIINNIVGLMKGHSVASEKNVELIQESASFDFYTDLTLLSRVLINMLKNALEATPTCGKVQIGCSKKEHENPKFWVQNEGVLPHDVQLQLFQRSFSTKGSNRGLGTYSMKLLGENYLKGKVSFESNSNIGTIFQIELPKL